jgi:hypothetical protein
LARSTNNGVNWTTFTGTVNAATKTVTVNNVPGFSTWTIQNNDTPLPVELTSFTGKAIADGAQLKWSTASEKNSKGFNVERSLDGKVFLQIGFVEGVGNSQTTQNYQFLDRGFNKFAYYRLVQVDLNGQTDVKQTIAVAEGINNMIVKVVPNPFRGVALLNIENLGNENSLVEANITDVTGRLVSSFKGTAQGSQAWLAENASKLGQGLFILNLVVFDGEETRQFTTKLISE